MRIQEHTNTTKTAIGYVRVSTQEQVSEGVSLDAQRDRQMKPCGFAKSQHDSPVDHGIAWYKPAHSTSPVARRGTDRIGKATKR